MRSTNSTPHHGATPAWKRRRARPTMEALASTAAGGLVNDQYQTVEEGVLVAEYLTPWRGSGGILPWSADEIGDGGT